MPNFPNNQKINNSVPMTFSKWHFLRLDLPKMISRTIWVKLKFLNFHKNSNQIALKLIFSPTDLNSESHVHSFETQIKGCIKSSTCRKALMDGWNCMWSNTCRDGLWDTLSKGFSKCSPKITWNQILNTIL